MPLEYWETCDSRQGGDVVDIGEKGLRFRSPTDMSIGRELGIRVFFSLAMNSMDSRHPPGSQGKIPAPKEDGKCTNTTWNSSG
jgi:hypothetical protein